MNNSDFLYINGEKYLKEQTALIFLTVKKISRINKNHYMIEVKMCSPGEYSTDRVHSLATPDYIPPAVEVDEHRGGHTQVTVLGPVHSDGNS